VEIGYDPDRAVSTDELGSAERVGRSIDIGDSIVEMHWEPDHGRCDFDRAAGRPTAGEHEPDRLVHRIAEHRSEPAQPLGSRLLRLEVGIADSQNGDRLGNTSD